MRRTWRWDPEQRAMVEVTRDRTPPASAGPAVHGDFKPMNVGGIVIEDRGHLRRYLKANDLAPYDPGAVKAARERIARQAAVERKRGVINAYEHARDQRRAKDRFG